jgi:hypothetical protein
MSIQALDNRRVRKSAALQQEPAWELFPLTLICAGLSISVLAALHLGGPIGVLQVLVTDCVRILVGIPLDLLILVGVAWLTNIYFGTLRQAVVRLAAFSIALQALGILLLYGLFVVASPLAIMVAVVLNIGGFCWLFGKLFDLEGSELVVAFVCAAGFQGIALGIWQLLP